VRVRRLSTGVLAGAALLAACTMGTGQPEPDPVDRLLVIDTDSAATMTPDGTDRVDVDPGEGARFFQGAWSWDAARVVLSGQAPAGPFLDILPAAEATAARLATQSLPFYLYWEPDGDRVAYLANGIAGIDLGIVTDAVDGPTDSLVATGQPYYFDWDPAGGRMVTHIGVASLDLLTPGVTSERLLDDPAPYQAPQWSPDGGRILHAETANGTRVVLTYPGDGRRDVLASYDGFAFFSMDPSGERVAIATLAGDAGPAITASFRRVVEPDTLVVVDVVTGDATRVGDEPTVGFWWSPQGDALLFLTVDRPAPNGPVLRWHVYESGVVNDLETFRPSAAFARDLLPFFDQYSRSMTLWSPDGTRFAYPGAPDGDTAGIWVHDLVTGERQRVSDGIFVAWSPR
jgi:TolB protein